VYNQHNNVLRNQVIALTTEGHSAVSPSRIHLITTIVHGGGSVQDRESAISIYLIFGLFAIAYFPAAQVLVIQWLELEEYSHAFLTVPIIGYLVWLKRAALQKQQSNAQQIVAMAVLTLSTLLYLVAGKLHVPSVINLTLIISLLSILLYFFSFNSFRELTTPILLAIMLVPIPTQIYSMITVPLQLKVSELSSFLMHLFNVPIFREGNILNIPGKTFQVIDACSGMRYIISIATLSLLFGYFTLHKNLSKIMLVLFAVPIAFLVNVIRVMTQVMAFHFFQIDWSTGTAHTLMGTFVFGLAILTLFFLQRILEFWEQK
jgi:exosortase